VIGAWAVIAIIAAMIIGAVIGGIAGYFGGWVDNVLMRVADLVFAFPGIILALAIAAALGPATAQRGDRRDLRVLAVLRPRRPARGPDRGRAGRGRRGADPRTRYWTGSRSPGRLRTSRGRARRVLEAGAGRIDFGAPHGLIDAEGVALLGTAVLPRLR
jgi:hypothetical protein